MMLSNQSVSLGQALCDCSIAGVFIFYSLHIVTAALLHELLNIYFGVVVLFPLIYKSRQ